MNDSKDSLLSYELELFKGIDAYEKEYRHKMSDKVFKTIPLIVALVGATIWLLKNYLDNNAVAGENIEIIKFILVVLSCSLMFICIILFFFALFGYKDMRPNPVKIIKLINERKKVTNNDEEIVIKNIRETMLETYKESAVSHYKNTNLKMIIFNVLCASLCIESILLIVTYLFEL